MCVASHHGPRNRDASTNHCVQSNHCSVGKSSQARYVTTSSDNKWHDLSQLAAWGVVQNCQHYQECTLLCDPLPPSLPKAYFKKCWFRDPFSKSQCAINEIFETRRVAHDPPLPSVRLWKWWQFWMTPKCRGYARRSSGWVSVACAGDEACTEISITGSGPTRRWYDKKSINWNMKWQYWNDMMHCIRYKVGGRSSVT